MQIKLDFFFSKHRLILIISILYQLTNNRENTIKITHLGKRTPYLFLIHVLQIMHT